MDMNFKRLMGDATRLTRTGDLDAATRAIRQALGEDSPGTGFSTPEAFRTPAGFSSAAEREGSRGERGGARTGTDDASIIEGEWERDDGTSSADAGAGGGARHGSGPERGAQGGTETCTRTRADTGHGAGHDVGGRTEAGGSVLRDRHVGRSGTLAYRLFVPVRPHDARPAPLVVMLHGCTQNADDFARGTRMDALASKHGFLVLYPEQSERANPQRCWNWFKHTHQRRGGGEAGQIEDCVRAVIEAHGADPARVFVAGLSAGGAMAAILGSVCPDLFAGIGVHSGLAAGAATNLPEALSAMRGGQGAPAAPTAAGTVLPPTIVFHGDADRTVHPDNGEGVIDACLAAANGAPLAEPTIERSPRTGNGVGGGRGWTRRVHRDAAQRVLAEHWSVHGAGHAWSGGDRRGSYADGDGPDASAEMVRFFLSSTPR